MLILLDIDNTLIHTLHKDTISDKWLRYFDHHILSKECGIMNENLQTGEGNVVFLRPGLKEFLNYLFHRPDTQVGIFTAGSASYAEELIHSVFLPLIDQEEGSSYCFFPILTLSHFDDCKYQTGGFKDLTYVCDKFPELRLKKEEILIIDDLILVKMTNEEQCYKIYPFQVAKEIRSRIERQILSEDQKDKLFISSSIDDMELKRCQNYLEGI